MEWLKSSPWVIPEEAVHESPLLKFNRYRVALAILEMEQEPTIEESDRICKARGCDSRRFLRSQAQTSGWDEGASMFYTCAECGRFQ
jgi:DNA-directed RNA polymerase subunit M/transcription elongation factor TFIIS